MSSTINFPLVISGVAVFLTLQSLLVPADLVPFPTKDQVRIAQIDNTIITDKSQEIDSNAPPKLVNRTVDVTLVAGAPANKLEDALNQLEAGNRTKDVAGKLARAGSDKPSSTSTVKPATDMPIGEQIAAKVNGGGESIHQVPQLYLGMVTLLSAIAVVMAS